MDKYNAIMQIVENYKPSIQMMQRGGIVRAQDGTTLSREDMFNAVAPYGLNRAQTRLAYRNAKRGLRDQGIWGKELRQTARQSIINSYTPKWDFDIEIEDEPIEIEDVDFGDLNTEVPHIPLMKTPASQNASPMQVEKIDTFGGSFNSAFAAARKSGLDEFTWNGKRYNTGLARNSYQSRMIDAVNSGKTKGQVLSDKNGFQYVELDDPMEQRAMAMAENHYNWANGTRR